MSVVCETEFDTEKQETGKRGKGEESLKNGGL